MQLETPYVYQKKKKKTGNSSLFMTTHTIGYRLLIFKSDFIPDFDFFKT